MFFESHFRFWVEVSNESELAKVRRLLPQTHLLLKMAIEFIAIGCTSHSCVDQLFLQDRAKLGNYTKWLYIEDFSETGQ